MVHIFYVPMRIWQTCSLFAWSELLCTNKVFNPIHYSLLIYPMLIPFHTRIDKILHPLFPYFPPPHWARGALPAGATLLGWPNYVVDGQLNWINTAKAKIISHCLQPHAWEWENISILGGVGIFWCTPAEFWWCMYFAFFTSNSAPAKFKTPAKFKMHQQNH